MACASRPILPAANRERCGIPACKGALFGLNLRHSRADIARSFLEGAFFEIKRCIEVLAETVPIDAVMISGNLVHAPSSTQMLADILDRAVGASPISRLRPSAPPCWRGASRESSSSWIGTRERGA